MEPLPATPAKGAWGRAHFARYILIGLFTVAPLWVTLVVLDFVVGLLAKAGSPFVRGVAQGVRPLSESLANWLLNPLSQYILAVFVTLAALYAAGLLTALVLGRRLIAFVERQLERVPLVQSIYGATKRFLGNLQKTPASTQRVVLISFPSPEMKAVGFVTRLITDPATGRQLAAVYVPTSPNPTSGYIEIVPLDNVVQTDWSMEEAMAFVMTGGTNAPDTVPFSNPVSRDESKL